MKIPLISTCFLAIALVAGPLFAKPEPTPSPANKGQNTPPPVEVPVPPGAAVKNPDPFKQVEEFFRALTEGRVESAYDQLLKGSPIADMSADVSNLKAMTTKAIRAYGEIMGFENVEKKELGTRLVRITYYSMNRQFPLRWRFYFYKATDAWKLIDVRVSDRLSEMFEESALEAPRPVK